MSQQETNQETNQETSKKSRQETVTRSRGGGQPKPRTPSGNVETWKRPSQGTSPTNRET